MTGTAAPRSLRLLLALDSGFEPLAGVALASFLRHNRFETVLVVTPEATELKSLPRIAAAMGSPLQQVTIPANSTTTDLPQDIRPYFYCIDAIQIACENEPARYLYVDADTLCVRDLSPLAMLPLSDEKPVAACSHGRPMHDRALVLGLESAYHYFNAGVLLFENEYLAQCLDRDSVVEFYRTHQTLCRFREQCALNAILSGKIQYLPSQYNYLSWMRARASHSEWHQLSANPMAYCLSDVRQQLAIAHLSAGAIPSRLEPKSLEEVDQYWIRIKQALDGQQSIDQCQSIPTYEDFSASNSSEP